MAKRKENNVDILEQGNIYFFYRPRVEEEDPESREDIQNAYMVLSPHGKSTYRLAILGRKRLPDPSSRGDRIWGFVQAVEKDPKRIVGELGEETYQTKTRGERHQPAARPAGEGVYQITRHDDHTHLVYALELPERPGEVQRDLEIAEEASYVVSIKNPEKPSPRGAGLPEEAEADYPKRLQEIFRDRKFADADPPDFLDYRGAEFILISAAEDVKQELGIDLNPQAEDLSSAEIFRDLRLRKSEHPLKPLSEGEWE